MDVIKRLDAVLKYFGLNQTDFAESIGVSQSTLSKQLKGVHKIDKQAALAIQAVYGVSSKWLLSGEGEMFVAGSQDSAPAAEFDEELMESVITIVTRMLRAEGIEFPPDKFAKLIIYLYNKHKDDTEGGSIDREIKENVSLLKNLL